MNDFLDHRIQSAHAIILQIKGQGFNRIDDSMHSMLREMTSLFGEDVWDRIIINIG